jgi:hypothetical protein
MEKHPKLRFYTNRDVVPQGDIALVSAVDVRELIEHIRDNDLDSLINLIDELHNSELFSDYDV